MGWLAINNLADHSKPAVELINPFTFGPSSAVLPVGTVMLECNIGALPEQQKNLLSHRAKDGWDREFTVALNPEGHISVDITQGQTNAYAYVPFAISNSGGNFRISISWDAPGRLGCLCVLNIDTDAAKVARVPNTIPLPLADALTIVNMRPKSEVSFNILTVAASDHIANPIQQGGFCAGSLFQTELGPRPVEILAPGDHVLTEGTQFHAVRAIRQYELPSTRFTQAVALRAPFFGLSHTTVVAPQQRLLISGPTIEYLFGFEDVFLEARHLLAHPAASIPNTGHVASYFEVEFDEPVCVSVGGAWSECRNVNGLGVAIASRTGAVTEFSVQSNGKTARPVLNGHEAVSLLNALSA